MLVALTLSVVSCSESDNTIDNLLDNVETGAIVRTLEEISDELNLNDTSSSYAIRVEEQDEEFGALFGSLDIYVTFDGDVERPETLLKTYTPADATESDNGLPELMLSSTYAEFLSALGLDQSVVQNNDRMELRLELKLTDGRVFSNDDVNADVSGAGYFNAPMEYTLRVKDL